MKILTRLILLLILVALGFLVWSFLFPNPQKVIRNRLNRVVKLASFSANDGNISRGIAIQTLGTYFSDDVEVKVDVPNYETHTFNHREELMQAAMGARSVVSSIKADFPDIKVDLGPDNLSATADVTLRADINGEKNTVVQELKIFLKKTNGEWLIYRIDTVRTLH